MASDVDDGLELRPAEPGELTFEPARPPKRLVFEPATRARKLRFEPASEPTKLSAEPAPVEDLSLRPASAEEPE